MKTLANAPFFTKAQLVGAIAVTLVLIALVVAISFGDWSGYNSIKFN